MLYGHRYLTILGREAESGRRYGRVINAGKGTWFKWELLAGPPSKLLATLAARNIVVVDEQAVHALLRTGSSVTEFPVRPLIEQPGWNGSDFALPAGETMGPRGGRKRDVVFDPRPRGPKPTGSLQEWQSGVAAPLNGQPLLMFALLLPFMAPLCELAGIEGALGFEIIAPSGSGKNTLRNLLDLAMGALGLDTGPGGAWDGSAGHASVNGLLAVQGDLSLRYIGQSKAKRLEAFRTHVLGIGQARTLAGAAPPYVTFSTESLAVTLGADVSLLSCCRSHGHQVRLYEPASRSPWG